MIGKAKQNNTEAVGFTVRGLAYCFENEQKALDPGESEIFCAS